MTETLGTAQLAQLGFSLIIVMGLIFGLAYLVKRWQGIRFRHGQQIKVTSSFSLGSKERLVIVEVEKQRLLLGVTPSNIQLLDTLAPVNQDIESEKQESTSFVESLQRVLSKGHV